MAYTPISQRKGTQPTGRGYLPVAERATPTPPQERIDLGDSLFGTQTTTPQILGAGTPSTLQLLGGFGRGIAQGYAAIGAGIEAFPRGEEGVFRPTGKIQKAIFGKEPISLRTEGEAISFGLLPAGGFGAPILAGVAGAVDLLGAGSLKGLTGLVKAVKGTKNSQNVFKLMKGAGFTDEIASLYSKGLAKELNTKEIEKALLGAEKLQNTTIATKTALPRPTKIAPTVDTPSIIRPTAPVRPVEGIKPVLAPQVPKETKPTIKKAKPLTSIQATKLAHEDQTRFVTDELRTLTTKDFTNKKGQVHVELFGKYEDIINKIDEQLIKGKKLSEVKLDQSDVKKAFEVLRLTGKKESIQSAFGGVAGFEIDDDGKLSFNPQKALLGVAGVAGFTRLKGGKLSKQLQKGITQKPTLKTPLGKLERERLGLKEPVAQKKSLVKDTTPTQKVKKLTVKEQKRTKALPDSFYKENAVVKKPSKVITRIKETPKQVGRGLEKALTPISTRLENISPTLKIALRKFEFRNNRARIKRGTAVLPLVKAVKKMSKEDRAIFDLARKNGDAKQIQKLIIKYGIGKEYRAYRKTLDDLYKEANKLGLDVRYVDHYAPRVLADEEGFLKHMRDTEEWDIIQEALERKAKLTGRPITDFTEQEQAQIANSLIRGYGNRISLSKPGAVKERSIDVIDKALNKFYKDSDEALLQYITGMTDAIESRKFFGTQLNQVISGRNKIKRYTKSIELRKSNIKKFKDEISETRKEITKAKAENKSTARLENKIETRERYIRDAKLVEDSLQKEKMRLEKDTALLAADTKIDDSIGAYVIKLVAKGEITPSQAKEVTEIFKARFQQGTMNEALRAYKNLEYIGTMGSPISAITQIGDLGLAVYKNGTGNTLWAGVTKKVLKREDIGIEDIAQEFVDGSTTGKAVTQVFKATGLQTIDKFGKETLINGSIKRVKDGIKTSDKKTLEEIDRVFGDEAPQFIDDIENGVNSENVRFWAYNDLADIQPISLSEMPEMYLKNPNGRILYMLKSYTIKLLDIYRRDVFREMKTNKIQATKNLVKLVSALAVTNATADEIKDLILGRKTSISDRTVESILKSMGLNRYTFNYAQRAGIGSAVVDQILPPASIADAISKSVTKGEPEFIKVLPIVGKIYFKRKGKAPKASDGLDLDFNLDLGELNLDLDLKI